MAINVCLEGENCTELAESTDACDPCELGENAKCKKHWRAALGIAAKVSFLACLKSCFFFLSPQKLQKKQT